MCIPPGPWTRRAGVSAYGQPVLGVTAPPIPRAHIRTDSEVDCSASCDGLGAASEGPAPLSLPGTAAAGGRGERAAEALSRLSVAFFALLSLLLSAAAIGDGRPASASVLLTFLGAPQGLPRPCPSCCLLNHPTGM